MGYKEKQAGEGRELGKVVGAEWLYVVAEMGSVV